MVYDGNGHVTEWGVWDISSATYQVQSNGAVTVTVNGSSSKSAQLISSTTMTTTTTQHGYNNAPLDIVKVSNLAACQGTWSGTFQETSGGSASHSLSFTVDSSGVATAFTGFTGPVTGKMFCESNAVAGFFKASQAAPYDNVRIYGTLSGNNVTDEAESNSSTSEIMGTLTLTKQ